MRKIRFTSARVAMASVAFAGVAVIAACSEGGVASSLNSPSVRLGQSTLPGVANAGVAQICVTGPVGDYTFVNSAYTQGANGTTVLNSPVGTPYTLTVTLGNPMPCVDVLVRTLGTTPQDAFSTVTVTQTGGPLGSTFFTSNCVDDAGNISSTGCGTNSVTINANRFHGTQVTFVNVSDGRLACTVTRGFIFNQLDLITNSTGPQIIVTINGTTLTKQQIYDALNAPTKGDSRVQLKAQLITALANISIGAQTNAAVDLAIANAQTYLLPGNTADKSLVSAAIDTLTTFNEGNAASPASSHCTDAQEAILKDKA